MKKILLLLSALLYITLAYGQNTLKAIIRDDKTHMPLAGATAFIPDLKTGTLADTSGLITINVPSGKFEIEFRYVGHNKVEKVISFPLQNPADVVEIYLGTQGDELDEITVQTTRTNQNLRDIPTRIEALPAEELDEKGTMRPGDIKMLLQESTGIAVQATSAVSGSANVRIQGLDSRYTQLLKDGMPMYQGFSGGLSLLQVSPLDLMQVEYIKGSASTLYGGGAIAGLVNLISKTPQAAPELTLLFNGTSAKGADASSFYSQKWVHVGTTVFSSYNYNGAYDPSTTGFSAIPKISRFSINPKLFLYMNASNTAWLGVNTTYEDRYGGDLQVLDGNADNTHQYFERNKTSRASTQLSYTHKIDTASSINFKNSIGYFNRTLTEPGSLFAGTQWSSFTELNYEKKGKHGSWVTGLNLLSDNFSAAAPLNQLNYNQTTAGVFGQNTYTAGAVFSLESGLRVDYNKPADDNSKGIFILPRVNALFKLSKHFSSRIGGGLGYKMPTLFNDVSEENGYQHIQPISFSTTKAERSYGANGDITYRGPVGDCYLTLNQLVFYTYVDQPIIFQNNTFVNAPGNIYTQGAETNIKFTADALGIYIGYTYTDTRLHANGLTTTQPLTPKNRVSFDLTYELEDSFRAGAEAFYTGQQLLGDGTTGRDYITFGLLLQKMWKHFNIYINCEDLTDRRQTRWDNIYTGSITQPVFRDIYAPLDGVVVNAGIRIKVL